MTPALGLAMEAAGGRYSPSGDPAFLDRFVPDARFEVPATLPAGGTYHSPSFESLEFPTTMAELFDSPYPDPEDYLRAGDHLVVFGTWRARSRQIGEKHRRRPRTRLPPQR